MQTINVYSSSYIANTANVKAALETYATDYFSSVTISDNIVKCYVDGVLWLTITVPSSGSSATFACVGKTQNCTFRGGYSATMYVSEIQIFDNAIVFVLSYNDVPYYPSSFVLTKNKAGVVTLLAANASYSSNYVNVGYGYVNSDKTNSFAAMSVGNDVAVYNVYRQYIIGGNVFGVPIFTSDSSTVNVLQSVVSAFSDQSVPHQIIVDGESWYSIVYDSIYIKST